MRKSIILLISVFSFSCGTIPADKNTTKKNHEKSNHAKKRDDSPSNQQNPDATNVNNDNLGDSLVVNTDNFTNKSGLTFQDGFENGLQTNWESFSPPVTALNKNNWQIDNKVKRSGNSSLRIEVRPGDMSKNNKSNRTELVGMKNNNGNFIQEDLNSGTQYYALSVMIPVSWVKLADKRGGDAVHGTILQLHGNSEIGGGIRPLFGLNITDRFFVMHHSGNVDNISYDHDREKYLYEFSNGKLNPGHWVDMVIKIKYASTNTGEIAIWRRDEGEKNFTKVMDISNTGTLFYQRDFKNVLPHKWHCGFYRSTQDDVTNILWLDCLTRASSFESAVTNAFGK